ncbi:MAG: TonB-dependent receptor [Tannerellaceae bacterium]|jgi:TonB-linked SusC/RagA family outer membrane protein|nr:TonB-dependent receptor [Tannerellaceae bacterium]
MKEIKNFLRNLLLVVTFLSAMPLPTVAQTARVKVNGTVTSGTDGEPLIGVNVVERGTANGVVTDFNGAYELSVAADARLDFSYIGFLGAQVAITAGTTVYNVVLKEDNTALEEVVVVGYGTQKKVTVTGSIASTAGKEIASVPITNVTNSLVGRLPGLIAVNPKGEPGYDDSNILIRGKSTTGDASPLIVVDGVADRAGGFARIDPQDIESVTILKDASAAIYGSRAANGVILVQTKRGQEGRFRVVYGGNVGFSTPAVIPEMAESWQYAQLLNEIETGIYGRSERYTSEEIQKFKDGTDPLNYPNTDAFNEVIGTAMQTQHNVSLSGGTNTVRFFSSFGYQYQDNYYKKSVSNYNQYNLRSNVDITPHKNFSASVNLSARQEDRNSPRSGSESIWRSIRVKFPTQHIVYPGTDYPIAQDGTNPLSASDGSMGYQKSVSNYYNGDLSLHFDLPFITQGLSVDGGLYLDLFSYQYKNFYKQYFFYTRNEDGYAASAYGPNNASLTHEMSRSRGVTLNGRINYERRFGRAHNLKAFAAYEQYTYRYDFLNGYRENFISTSIDQLFAGDRTTASNTGTASESARMNYFGRLDYDYDGKYLFQFNWRYDGSQNFPKGKRFGFFPGVSFGWRLSEEDFWKEHLSFIENFKLRGSYGQMGNDKVDPFQYITSYTFDYSAVLGGSTPQQQTGVWQSRTPNPAITWEIATTYNLGLDAYLWNSLQFSLDFFRSERGNILATRDASLPAFSGLSLPDENFGECFSRGFETILDYTGHITKDLQFRIGGNLSYSTNRIRFIDEPSNVLEWQRRTGKPIDATWVMYRSDGIFRTLEELEDYPHLPNAGVGDVRFVDVNNDGTINGNDQVRLSETGTPEWIYGVNLGLNWRRWSLSSLWQGAGNVWTYQFFEAGTIGNFTKDFYENRWTPDTPNSRYPRTYNLDTTPTGLQNTFWLNSASYVRLKSVELSYSLPATALRNSFMENLRVYVSGYNLLTFTHLRDLDPESKSSDKYSEGADTPQTQVINFGINITF